MTAPALTVTDASTPTTSADVLVVAARAGRDGVTVLSGSQREELAQQLRAVGFAGGRDELVRLPGDGSGPSLAVIGLPDGGEDALRYAAGSAVRQLAGAAAVAIDFPTEGDAQLGAIV
ncbi:MAG: leucyl aminopeptidase, partial [Leifsonia sp.]|nr:leucyl aminopeptidase [Leifsonia sp.]